MPEDTLNEEETDPKNQETSEWTDVSKLENRTVVKPYDIETLATSKIPHNIPYLEVFRTDELYFKPYVSPYLSSGVDGTTSTGDTGSDASGESGNGNASRASTLWTALSNIVWKYYPASKNKDYWVRQFRSKPNTWSAIGSVVNNMGGNRDKQNNVIREVMNAKKEYSDGIKRDMASTAKSVVSQASSSMTRNAKLKTELTSLVKKYYKTETHIHYSSIVNRYMKANNDRISIGAVTLTYRSHLRGGVQNSTVNTAILNTKKKYSK